MTPICVLITTKNELQIVSLVVYASETNYKGFTGAPNEDIVQNHFGIALLNVF